MEQPATLSQWLEERCQSERLSLRQAAEKTGLSHVTIRDIKNGGHASPETIRKLAQGFGNNNKNMVLALEDKLLILAGHRSQRQQPALSEPMARLLDKLSQFTEPQLKVMGRFADFVSELEKRSEN